MTVTDRDRSDLMVTLACMNRDNPVDLAVRLIALGWTRLDEERLARAVHDAEHRIDAEWWDSHPLSAAQDMEAHRDLAAAIAKAYREDENLADALDGLTVRFGPDGPSVEVKP